MLDSVSFFILIIFIVLEIIIPLLIKREENSSDFANDNEFSEQNSENKKTIIILPLSALEENQEFDEYFENIELPPFYSMKQIEFCYNLLKRYHSCSYLRKPKIEKCKNIFREKIQKKEICGFIRNYILNKNNKLIDFGEFYNNDVDDEDKLNINSKEIFEQYNENEEIKVIDNNDKININEEKSEINNNMVEIVNNNKSDDLKVKDNINNNINDDDYNNKDCVEYGLSEENENFIVCLKYE